MGPTYRSIARAAFRGIKVHVSSVIYGETVKENKSLAPLMHRSKKKAINSKNRRRVHTLTLETTRTGRSQVTRQTPSDDMCWDQGRNFKQAYIETGRKMEEHRNRHFRGSPQKGGYLPKKDTVAKREGENKGEENFRSEKHKKSEMTLRQQPEDSQGFRGIQDPRKRQRRRRIWCENRRRERYMSAIACASAE